MELTFSWGQMANKQDKQVNYIVWSMVFSATQC